MMLGMDRSLERLPVIVSAIHSAERAITAAGGTLFLADIPHLTENPESLKSNRIDAVILKGALQGTAIAESKSEAVEMLRGLPCVWLLNRPAGCADWGDVVGTDDIMVGQLAAEYLASHGHRDVAIIDPKPDHVTISKRRAGFQLAADQHGLNVKVLADKTKTSTLPLKPAEDVSLIQSLVDRMLDLEKQPTAVFAPIDSVAVLIYRALATRGVVVGRDISVISANNEQSLISGLFPELTVLDAKASQVGKEAVDLLIRRTLSRKGQPPMSLYLHPTLVEGDSVVAI